MKKFQLVLTVTALVVPGFAGAQGVVAPREDPGADAGDAGSLLDDIVVSAQKKNVGERAQDVPIAVTPIGSSQLEALNVRSLSDLAAFAPNANLDPNGTVRGYANFAIRGSALNSSIPSLEPAVGLFVDGIYQGISAGSISDNFDLASVQILRGPQGTLFGRNVTGGAVLVETARPSGRFGGYAEASIETGPEYGFKAAVEGPIVADLLSARLAGYYRKDDGWFTNDFDGSKFGKLETFIVRPSLLLETGPLKQTVIFEYGDVSGDSNAPQALTIDPRTRPFAINLNETGDNDQRWYSATSETVIDVGFGDGAITNVFGYRDFKQYTKFDFDASPLSLFHGSGTIDQHQLSDELRYAGRFGPADVTVGVYFLTQELLYREARIPFVGGARGGGGRQTHDSYGVFGQVSVELTDTLSAIAGLRYSYEKKSAKILTLTTGRCLDVQQACDFDNAPTVASTRNWDSISPKLGLNYKPNADLLIYASYGQAVRSGGFNLRLSSPADPGTYDPETMTAYEIGIKSDFLDRRLRVNASVFINDYKELQRTVTTFVGPSVVQSIDNSADARIRGFELEVTMQPTPGLEAVFGLGYLDAKYTEVRGDLNGDRVVDAADLNLPLARVPEWSISTGIIHTLTFNSDASLRSQVFFSHRSKQSALDSGIAFFDPYNDLRADITFTLPNRTSSISLFGRNLTDEPHNTAAVSVINAFPSRGHRVISEGRSLGVELRQRF